MTQKLTIEQMQQVAAKRGGKCLSKKYLNNRTKLLWQCSKDHIWEAPPNTIQQGHWCPTCAGRPKITIAEMQNIAKSKGGICLSKAYVNAHSHLEWKCKHGHEWKATPNNIRGGKCLSEKYINTGKRSRGH